MQYKINWYNRQTQLDAQPQDAWEPQADPEFSLWGGGEGG